MSELASRGQLRMTLVRTGLVIVPAVLLLGVASGVLSGSSAADGWFEGLAKPAAMPPAWAFPVAWTILYLLLGVALTMIVAARGARGRGAAIGLFLVQFVLNLAWSPMFFGLHRIGAALLLILAMILATVVTIAAFARIRRRAAWLMLPYLAWLCFAAWLNYRIWVLNPDGLAPVATGTHVAL